MWHTVKRLPCGCEFIQHSETKRVHVIHCTLCRYKEDGTVPPCPEHGGGGMRCLRCIAVRGGSATSHKKKLSSRRNFKIAALTRWGRKIPAELRRKPA